MTKDSKSRFRKGALTRSLMAGGALAALIAGAAQAADATGDEVVVTGSLFRGADLKTPSPVAVITLDSLREAGVTTVADAVRSISADNSGSLPTAFGAGFAEGASGVALRGLTVNSTLVLIDGRRTANYPLADDGERGFVDLNTIPFGVIDRIEVLKDGASSIYGADAIGGVVNIILKSGFQGAEAEAETGLTQYGGGGMSRLSATIGRGDLASNRYNAYLNVEYQRDDRISVGQRAFPFNTNDLSAIGGNNLIGGQPQFNSGSIYGSVTPGQFADPADLTSGVPNPGAVSQPLRPCGQGSMLAADASGNAYCAQNLTRYGDDQPSQERIGVYGRITGRLNGDAEVYASASYTQDRVKVHFAPAQIQNSVPYNTDGIALPATLTGGGLNPNDPFAASGDAALINYAFGDIPGYGLTTSHMARVVSGLQGSWDGWRYDAGLTLSHSWLDSAQAGLLNYQALLSDIAGGGYSFIDPASNSAAVRAALSPTLKKRSTTDLDSLDLRVTRPLLDLPGGALRLGLGAEIRYEAAHDPSLNPNLATEAVGPLASQTIGRHTVASTYAELDAPVLKQLTINLSGRYDHYSDFGGAFSPKLGAVWTPVPALAFRATLSKGFRAPSFSESGSSAAEGFVNFTPPASFQAAHMAGGVIDGYAQQYSLAELTAGNPKIKPEQSDTYTLGLVFKPDPHLRISLDYYHIRNRDVITPAPPSAALDAYFAGQPLPAGYTITLDNPDPAAPGAQARPVAVSSPYINANAVVTDGIDLDIDAHVRLWGGLALRSEFGLTDILSFRVSLPDGTNNDYVGLQSPYILSSGGGTPKYRASWQNSLTFDKLTVSATTYYVSPIRAYGVDVAPYGSCLSQDAVGNAFPSHCVVKAFFDTDLTAEYQLTQRFGIFLNVLNVTDARPPLDPANYAGVNYDPSFHQAGIVGRMFKVGVRARF
jgi:iron complex outermembrane receptor protein